VKKFIAVCTTALALTACGPSGNQEGAASEDASTYSGQGQIYDRGGATGQVDIPKTNATVNTNSEGQTGGAASGTVPPSSAKQP
jgi:hypothetical protein